MNIKKILNYGGYEVLKEIIITNSIANWTYKYQVKISPDKINKMTHDIEKNGTSYDYNLNDTLTVVVTDVGFNGLGYLWLSIAIENELEECWDVIEFEREDCKS